MKNKLILTLCFFLCLLIGFAVGAKLTGTGLRTYTAHTEDVFYTEPSLTSPVVEQRPALGQELQIIEKLELKRPVAAQLKQDLQLQDKDKTYYQLRRGDLYKILEPRLEKANQPCLLEVTTLKGGKAQLEVPKSDLVPVAEGSWLRLRSTSGELWLQVESKWY